MNTPSPGSSIVRCILLSFATLCLIRFSTAKSADPPAASLTVDWKARAAKGLVLNGEAIDLTEQRPFAASHALKVVSQAAQPVEQTRNPVILMTTIENPPITKQHFALNGWIQYKGVERTGYVEMWTLFADGSHYFSRTLDVAGPLQSLSGDSDWRRISVPFQLSADPQAPKPNKLIVNVVLPGAGEITLSDVILAEADRAADAIKSDAGSLTIDWKDRAAAKLVANGEAIELKGQRPFAAAHALKVVSPAKPGETVIASPVILLATVENPPITKQHFAFNGWIRHKGVAGPGYLEMWVLFADGSHYFSRTLDGAGPLQSLSGDSDWREISLPFQLSADPKAPKPSKLILNAVLPGAGEITLSDLTLTEANNITAAVSPGAWWSDRTAGWVGGIGGTLLGLIGAVIGTLCSLGIGRRFVVPLLIAGSLLGGGLFVLGTIALAIGQPYGVYYPLLLCGMLCGVLGGVGLVVGRQRYAQAELRRMQALDA
jgi:hypothetical protein